MRPSLCASPAAAGWRSSCASSMWSPVALCRGGQPLERGAVSDRGSDGRVRPGGAIALKHGSYVSDLRLSADERTAELAELIAETQPLAHPADSGAVWRLARV